MRILPLILLLSACSLARPDGAPMPDISVTEAPGDDVTRPQPRPVAGYTDATVVAPPAPAADGFLGETLAGLDVTGGQGLWLQTGLVAQGQPGRVETASGATTEVELRPNGAAASSGSQISLQAMQRLGLPLGALASLRVYVD